MASILCDAYLDIVPDIVGTSFYQMSTPQREILQPAIVRVLVIPIVIEIPLNFDIRRGGGG